MAMVLIGIWVGQALLLGTFLSALESGYGRFTLYWWAYAYGIFWPFLIGRSLCLLGLRKMKDWVNCRVY